MKFRCAWKDCNATCDYLEDLPPEWSCLVTFRKTATPGVLDFRIDHVNRDALLCPEHSVALEKLLFPF
jgi:hypothetical protein